MKKVKIKFPKIKLLIIGGGSERQLLEQLVEKHNLKENVEFKGFINPQTYLLSSKILILNSFFEGLPNVLIEGMTSKIPIISTDCESGPREILENGKFGALIKVNKNEELYKKIIYTLEHYDEAKKKSEEGFKSLVRFDKTKQLKKINDYILNI